MGQWHDVPVGGHTKFFQYFDFFPASYKELPVDMGACCLLVPRVFVMFPFFLLSSRDRSEHLEGIAGTSHKHSNVTINVTAIILPDMLLFIMDV